jgi:putative ABC transport system permease protein
MDALLMALKAIRWRAGASVTVLLVAVFATATAAAGPVYLAAASDSILQYTLRTSPTTATGSGMEVTNDVTGRPGTGRLTDAVGAALRGGVLRRAYPAAVTGLEYQTRLLDPAGRPNALATVTYRQDACAHVRLVAGACVAEGTTDQVMISRRTATERGWGPDTVLTVDHFADPVPPASVTARAMRVVGVYEPTEPGGGYWFNDTRHYFGAPDERTEPTNPPTVEALFVPQSAFAAISRAPAGDLKAVVDLPFRRTAVHTADVPALRAQVDGFGTGLAAAGVEQHGFNGAVVTHVRTLLDRADTGQQSLRVPMLLVVGQLLLLGWYVLFMVAAGAAEARGGEVALAKLRGLPAAATLAFGVFESVLLLVASVPIGVAVGTFAVRTLARPIFGADALLTFPAAAWLTAGLAAAGGLAAAAAGGLATFRRPVLAQWRRADRDVGGRNAVADAVVFTLALAGLGELWWGGTLARGRVDVLALAAPGLLAVAGALVGARVLPVLARTGQAPTRGSRRVGLFLAVRQVARRPGGPRVVAVLATAFALATFSVLAWSVFAQNRHDRAAVETGAARLVTVDPLGGPDVREVVDRLDPAGRWAMAVTNVGSEVAGATSADLGASDGPSSTPLRLLAVEPDRLANVGYWRADFGQPSLAAVARSLSAPTSVPLAPAMTVRGDALRLAATNEVTSEHKGVDLGAELTTAGGEAVLVRLAPTGDGHYEAGVPCRDAPCRLRALTVTRAEQVLAGMVGTLTVTAVEQRTTAGWRPVDGALDPTRWAPANPRVSGQDEPVEKVGTGPASSASSAGPASAVGLAVRYAAPAKVARVGVVAAAPDRIPAVVTPGYAPPPGTRELSFGAPTGAPIDVTVTRTVRVLPRAGDAGALVSLDQLVAARPAGYASLLPGEVWLADGAPADFPDRLAAAGVRVTSVTSAAQRQRVLSHQGPALAVALMLAGAAAAALLAAAGAVVNLHLLARRRAFELAALRTLGIRRGSLAAALGVEQAILVGFAILLGVCLGLLGARMALPSIPEYADVPAFPPLLVRPDPWLVVRVAAGLAASGYALLRAAVPTRLREAQA